MEKHLYEQLQNFNQTIENPYKKNWGTTALFIDSAW
jgi:hypothetical protein